MAPGSNKSTLNNTVVVAAGIGLILVLLRTKMLSKLLKPWKRNPLKNKTIKIIETVDECQRAVNELNIATANYKVLGFDCEWVTVGGSRRPVALLQLASHQGLCALFRLCNLRQIPKCLREVLENDEVIKVGVAPHDDAQKLSHDYGVGVASTFDLRYLATLTGHKAEGLAKLSKNVIKVHINKNWRLSCSDWEAKVLNEKQEHYAADDALVAVKLFEQMGEELEPSSFWSWKKNNFPALLKRLEPFMDARFREGFSVALQSQEKSKVTLTEKKLKPWQMKKTQQTRGIATRSKALYDNCLLEAPDGELLCTIDRQKAKWYMDQKLGAEVNSDPFTVRLNFEPAGRAVGEVGRYYQTPKENQCVVCGRRDMYIRKNVVPREYRKHFPDIMKTHTSHDVLLLCPICHQTSNISDLKIRTKLAEMCEAPFVNDEGSVKCFEVPELKKVRSAARALLMHEDKIPEPRRGELKLAILAHFKDEDEITNQLLQEAANINTTVDNEKYCEHGSKVVKKFQSDFGGLIELEKMWREHFLHSMKPKFLPNLWNVNHNANRLEIRANEGRINKEDLLVAGLNETLLSTQKEQ